LKRFDRSTQLTALGIRKPRLNISPGAFFPNFIVTFFSNHAFIGLLQITDMANSHGIMGLWDYEILNVFFLDFTSNQLPWTP